MTNHGQEKRKTLWIFDENRRIYRYDENHRAIGSPIYREYWKEFEITGETSRSWLTKFGKKITKKGGKGIAFSIEQVDQDVFIHEHRHKIADKVNRLFDYDKLTKIAGIIGYEANDK